jgi:hypothetical protein
MYKGILEDLVQVNIITSRGINPKYKIILVNHPDIMVQLELLTPFIKHSSHHTRERLYCVINNITESVLCKHCANTSTNFITNGIYRNTYSNYCSLKCSNNAITVKAKKQDTSIQHYGVNNPSQSSQIKLKKIQTSQQCYGSDYPWQQYADMALLMDKDRLHHMHAVQHNTLTEIAKLTNTDVSVVGTYFKLHNIDIKRFPVSQAELDIINLLNRNNINHINTNSRSIIAPYELDIFLPDYNLAIEYCGLYWHSNKFKNKLYHRNKLAACNRLGIRLITIFENEWIHNKPIVEQKILSILLPGRGRKVHARKTTVVIPSHKDKQQFLNQYHIQGTGPGSITYALITEDNTIVAVMTFIKQANDTYILNRYATSTTVMGGFSKLLSHFKMNNDWKKIVSFADMRWSEGGVYRNSGFILDAILPPDYMYIVGTKLIHKFNYRRKNLPKLLKVYDPNLSEMENTKLNNIQHIWNCGLQRWVMYN